MTSSPATDPTVPAAGSLDAPGDRADAHARCLDELAGHDAVRRLRRRDGRLWPRTGGRAPLGFLGRIEAARPSARRFAFLRRTVAGAGIRDVLWLGMGGASLFAQVAAETLATGTAPRLHVVDTTCPDVLRDTAAALDPAATLAVVASKSGTTLETTLLERWAEGIVAQAGEPRRRMAYVTDPGTPMDRRARTAGAFAVFPGRPDVGGRFSATTDFGLVPAALAGADVSRLLSAAAPMERACRVPAPARNPGAWLAAVLAAAEASGARILTLLADPPWRPFCAWIEQLVAESTGKQGRGLLPLWDEPQDGAVLGEDRLVVRILGPTPSSSMDERARQAREHGAMVATIRAGGTHNTLAEVVRWQTAVALAGHLLQIDPFDQPDVEATKAATRRLLEGATDERPPDFVADGFELRGDVPEAAPRLAGAIRALVSSIPAGGYLAVLAFLPPGEAMEASLRRLRAEVRAARGLAVAFGWGPRYLHASGQFHKGGPPVGGYLVLDRHPSRDVPVPDAAWTFGAVQRAQARADAEVLRARGRPVLEVTIRPEEAPEAAVARLADHVRAALRGGGA